VFFGTDVAALADRIAYIATMFLTGQAFQVVATAETPSLGYLTMIDHFLVGSNIFIYILLVVSVFITLYSSGVNFHGDKLEEGDPGDWVNIICLMIFGFIYTVFCISWAVYARFVSIPTEVSKLLASPLKLSSVGLVYMLTYLDDSVPYQSTIRSISPRSLYRGGVLKIKSTDIQDQITRIICKQIRDGKAIIKYLNKVRLSKALTTFREVGRVRNPHWKVYDIEKKYAWLAGKGKRNSPKHSERDGRIVYI